MRRLLWALIVVIGVGTVAFILARKLPGDPVRMLVGPQAEIPEDLEQTPLIMGICLHHLKDEGRYVVGCPPNNDKMQEAIMELTGIEA